MGSDSRVVSSGLRRFRGTLVHLTFESLRPSHFRLLSPPLPAAEDVPSQLLVPDAAPTVCYELCPL